MTCLNRARASLLVPLLFVSMAWGISQAADLGLREDLVGHTDNPSHPLGDAQKALKLKALEAKLKGKTSGPVAEVAKGQFVELERQGEDKIWTVLAEFGSAGEPVYGFLNSGVPGPLHNEIPEPDRAVDNTTIWAADFSQGHYEELLFSEAPGAVSMRNYYVEQSANRYTVNGEVTDWGQVPYQHSVYGRNYCGGIVCPTTWWFVNDAVDDWYNNQLASMTPAEINDYLSQFDVWDRYDYDGDGNFDEPDGYIDHFQVVHAGEGEETGGGAQGSDAIWSHRWYAFFPGSFFPKNDGAGPNGFGGAQIGNSDYWVGDYTIEPENGGVGVFAHEFAHDLDLPDLYDTSGNTGGADNSTAFWTLMSSGSYGNSGLPEDGLGTKPIPMSAYEKIFLGWSNYEVVGYGQSASLKLGPSNFNTKQTQHLVVLLPDKVVNFEVDGEAYSGDYWYFSGSDNNLNNTMTREFTLPAGAPMLTAKVNFDIELDWDYAYLEVNGTPVATNFSTNTDPFGQNDGNGITGSSGGWADLTADLSAYAGQTVTIGFRYWTDVAVVNPGLAVDDIAVDGNPLDDAEMDFGWNYGGFVRTNGVISQSFFNAYFAEFRTYKGYDDALRTGPYNFTGDPFAPNLVEHYPYQDGLLVWYYDTSFDNNNIGDHCLAERCGGLYLPVDAHPDLLLRPDDPSRIWRGRLQSHDSTFGLSPTDTFCLTLFGEVGCYGGLPANPMFDDTQSYWVAPDAAISNNGWYSVQVPNTGTTIRVVSISAQGNFMQVHVNK